MLGQEPAAREIGLGLHGPAGAGVEDGAAGAVGRGDQEPGADGRTRHGDGPPEMLGPAQAVSGQGGDAVGRAVREDGDGAGAVVAGEDRGLAAEGAAGGPQRGAVLVDGGEAHGVSVAAVAQEDPVELLRGGGPPGLDHDHHEHLEGEPQRGGVDDGGLLAEEGGHGVDGGRRGVGAGRRALRGLRGAGGERRGAEPGGAEPEGAQQAAAGGPARRSRRGLR